MKCLNVLGVRTMAAVGEGTFDAEQLLLGLLAARVIADGVDLTCWMGGAGGQLHRY